MNDPVAPSGMISHPETSLAVRRAFSYDFAPSSPKAMDRIDSRRSDLAEAVPREESPHRSTWQRWEVAAGNAVKDLEAGFSRYVAVRSANVRIFAERRATYLPTV
jgi:hypothetical protein